MTKNSRNNLTELTKQLKLNWFGVLERSPAHKKLKEKIFCCLVERYSEPVRRYHNLKHVYDLLNSIKQVENIAEDINILQFAAWFHDYIYDPQSSDNETKSAVSAVKALEQLHVERQKIKAIEQIILSTKNHQPLSGNFDNLLFLDIDLAILGTTPHKYQKYAQAIRQEYSYLSERDYQIGRKKVLVKFINRERIYYTKYFYHSLETVARKNLQTEINYLDRIDLA